MEYIERKIKIIFLFIFFILYSFSLPQIVSAETEQEKLERLQREIQEYQEQITKLKSQASTLNNQIAQFDAQIRLATLKIDQTEEKITLLGGRIDQLEGSLESLSKAYASRAVYSYKISRLHEPLLMLITSDDLASAFSNYRYLQKIQEADRNLLVRLENAQVNYEVQKKAQEELQQELEGQKKVLGSQKTAKASLLEQTKNDEKRYQQLLSSVRSEYESIQAIIAGKGQETVKGHVNAGERIATVIQGPSCNSSGAHLHFIVSQNGKTANPFSYLKPGISFENCSGSACSSGDGDSFNPSGNWEWPINPTIKYSQGYGATWAVRNTWVGRVYSFHNGIDINNAGSPEVKSVSAGTLYQGSYAGSRGCRLKYVRVDHDDSDLDTFYLHINY